MTSHTGALAQRFGLPVGSISALETLLAELADPAAPTGVHDPARAIDVHIADSLVALDLPVIRAARVLADLGSGAGLPGLALAAALPGCEVHLIESNGRKAAWAAQTSERCGLRNVQVVPVRAEEWTGGRGGCDVVTARALATLPVLCEYAAPLLREPDDGPGATLVAWKGAVERAEAADAAHAAQKLGLGEPEVHAVQPYPGSERRTLWTVEKLAPTPAGYPRRAGVATKRPISAPRP